MVSLARLPMPDMEELYWEADADALLHVCEACGPAQLDKALGVYLLSCKALYLRPGDFTFSSVVAAVAGILSAPKKRLPRDAFDNILGAGARVTANPLYDLRPLSSGGPRTAACSMANNPAFAPSAPPPPAATPPAAAASQPAAAALQAIPSLPSLPLLPGCELFDEDEEEAGFDGMDVPAMPFSFATLPRLKLPAPAPVAPTSLPSLPLLPGLEFSDGDGSATFAMSFDDEECYPATPSLLQTPGGTGSGSGSGSSSSCCSPSGTDSPTTSSSVSASSSPVLGSPLHPLDGAGPGCWDGEGDAATELLAAAAEAACRWCLDGDGYDGVIDFDAIDMVMAGGATGCCCIVSFGGGAAPAAVAKAVPELGHDDWGAWQAASPAVPDVATWFAAAVRQ